MSRCTENGAKAGVREAAMRLHRGSQPFDGVFCASDQIARGLVDGLRDVGRRVPDDVGIVGVDNWDAMVEGSRPALTSVDLNLTGLGQTAAALLVAAINGDPLPPGPLLVPTSLVKRRSTDLVLPPDEKVFIQPAASAVLTPTGQGQRSG